MRFLFIALLMLTESVLAGTLVFGPGVHYRTKPIVINTSNTFIDLQPGAVLRGVDPIVIIKGPVTNIGISGGGTLEGGVISYGSVTNISLQNFSITLAENAVFIAAQSGGCRDLRITGMNIYNVGEGIVFRNCQSFLIDNNTISDMWAQDGIEPINSQRGIISNNRITNPGTNNSAIDVFVNKSTLPGELAEVSSLTISNNILTRTTPGFYASGINIQGNVVGANLRGNQIIGTFGNGIRLLEKPHNITITDNIFRDINVGISVEGGENLIITNSQFTNVYKYSIATGTQIGPPVFVLNNKFSGNAIHIVANTSVTADANTFTGMGWAILNGWNTVMNVTNNEFLGPYSISNPSAPNLFKINNIGE
jgi:hypothetical protein